MDFDFVRNLHSSVFQVPPQVPESITRANPHCRPHSFFYDFRVREHGREHRIANFNNILKHNYQLRAHINGPQTPVNHFMHRVSPYPLIIFLKTFFENCEYFDLLCIFCTLAIKARRLGKQRLPKDEWCYLGDEMYVFKDE